MSNRLAKETSPYLLQHAENPVDWYPWGSEALERAKREERPILLSVGYAACHWCHVMERESFEDPKIADVMNEHFVCIKVDREELPAIDAAYMEAVQLLTGSGGWPMSVFLTPDLRPFFGGTYFPRDRFLALLARIRELWGTRRADLERQAGEITQHLVAEPATAAAADDGQPVDHALLGEITSRAHAAFDHDHGGLAGPMKFPVPVRWSALLHWWRRSGDPTARTLVTATLEAMAAGGLRDHLAGGFHRYTVDPHWTVPHFEKMLYDNAQLASLFLEAGAAFSRPDFTVVGLETLDFLTRDLSGSEGPCYASLDADSGGREGTFYVWTPEQITAVAGPQDGPPLAELLGVTAAGNFEAGTSVLVRRAAASAVAARHGHDPAAVAGLFERHRAALLAVRAERVAPGLDRKIITAWNGLAISAYARGYMASGRNDLRERAVQAAAYLREVHRDAHGRLLRASNGGQAVGEAILEDHALLARGLLDLFQVTGHASHLAWALELLETAERAYRRPAGGWFATAEASTPLGRRLDLFDSVLPSGGSAQLDALITAAALTGNAEARARASAEMAAQAGLIRRAGLEMAGWLTAALRLAGPLHEVVIAGDPGERVANDLLRTAWSRLSPGVVVVPVPAGGAEADLLALAPALAGKIASQAVATAHVCRFGVCEEPVNTAAALTQALGRGWEG
jgi:uncharacterized protein